MSPLPVSTASALRRLEELHGPRRRKGGTTADGTACRGCAGAPDWPCETLLIAREFWGADTDPAAELGLGAGAAAVARAARQKKPL